VIWLPPLSLDALLRRRGDGSYRLIVASSPSVVEATKIATVLREHGYAAVVTLREIARDHVLHRVEITTLNTRAAAVRAWETAKRLDLIDYESAAIAGGYRAARAR
jgi:hypothetical protein